MRLTPRSGLLALLLCITTQHACTRVSDTDRFETNAETVEILRTDPPAGAVVSDDVRVRICWSGPLDPRSLTDVDAVMTSGNSVTDAALRLELLSWTDAQGMPLLPGTATGDFPEEPWCPGSVVTVTPKERLVGGVRYRLRLEDTARGWNGEAIDTETDGWIARDNGTAFFFVEFDVDDTPQAPAPEEEDSPITLTQLFAPGGVFDPGTATCSCHRDSDELATQLLDLSDPETAFDALVFDSRPRDTFFPMVSPRRPSESFLVHKLIDAGDGHALPGIRGDRMPLDGPLPYPDYVAIAQWIADGALP